MGFGLSDERARHVVMICIDGLKPSVYTEAGPAKVPTLRRVPAGVTSRS
jgi:hypothetical protein